LVTTILLRPDWVRDVLFESIPALIAQLAAAQSLLAVQLVDARSERRADSGRLLTVEDAAEKLGVSQDWLYRRAASLGYLLPYVLAGHFRFTEDGLDRWIRSRNG
jgi:hypothetical protein